MSSLEILDEARAQFFDKRRKSRQKRLVEFHTLLDTMYPFVKEAVFSAIKNRHDVDPIQEIAQILKWYEETVQEAEDCCDDEVLYGEDYIDVDSHRVKIKIFKEKILAAEQNYIKKHGDKSKGILGLYISLDLSDFS